METRSHGTEIDLWAEFSSFGLYRIKSPYYYDWRFQGQSASANLCRCGFHAVLTMNVPSWGWQSRPKQQIKLLHIGYGQALVIIERKWEDCDSSNLGKYKVELFYQRPYGPAKTHEMSSDRKQVIPTLSPHAQVRGDCPDRPPKIYCIIHLAQTIRILSEMRSNLCTYTSPKFTRKSWWSQ